MSMGNTRAIVVGRFVSVILTLTVGIVLTFAFGIYGTLIGAAITQVAMGGVLAYKLAQGDREELLAKPRSLPRGSGAW